MRYAILADVHSNLTALNAVLKDIERRGGVDEFWCLGDIVGYGPDPQKCIEALCGLKLTAVAGNHDMYWRGSQPPPPDGSPRCRSRYRPSHHARAR